MRHAKQTPMESVVAFATNQHTHGMHWKLNWMQNAIEIGVRARAFAHTPRTMLIESFFPRKSIEYEAVASDRMHTRYSYKKWGEILRWNARKCNLFMFLLNSEFEKKGMKYYCTDGPQVCVCCVSEVIDMMTISPPTKCASPVTPAFVIPLSNTCVLVEVEGTQSQSLHSRTSITLMPEHRHPVHNYFTTTKARLSCTEHSFESENKEIAEHSCKTI